MIPFSSVLFIIISLICLIVPIIICYKFFSKGEKGSMATSMYYVSMLTFAPMSVFAPVVQLSVEVTKYLSLIFGFVLGITFVGLNFYAIKKNIQYHDHYIINYACGVFVMYTFFFYFVIGIVIWILTDENGEIKVFNNDFTNQRIFIISVYIFIYFLGVSSSFIFEFLFYKNNKFKYLIGLAFVIQFSVFFFNVFTIFDIFNASYLNLIIAISCICLSIFAWFTLSTNEERTSQITSNSDEALTNK